jgi:hypothetical protein
MHILTEREKERERVIEAIRKRKRKSRKFIWLMVYPDFGRL